ncbi:MAG: AccB, partial [Deltaproteobacteria bacterium]|nr:AccB [Deltaproteobacteria bacterium]
MKSGKLRSVAIGVIAASLCCMGCLSGTAEAQVKYPTKPIELVNTFPPGGPTDIPARIVITELSKELGTQITMQYKPGAGGMIG